MQCNEKLENVIKKLKIVSFLQLFKNVHLTCMPAGRLSAPCGFRRDFESPSGTPLTRHRQARAVLRLAQSALVQLA